MSDHSASKQILFIGTHLKHAITNRIHDEVAKSLNLNWRLLPLDTLDLGEFDKYARGALFGGAVITIPHKLDIISHLDHVDTLVGIIGACNNVYLSDRGLTGTNTDWVGVRDALRAMPGGEIDATAGFIVGAGGAARAALYALAELGCSKVYVINRDVEEVRRLQSDVRHGYAKAARRPPVIVHLQDPSEVEEPPMIGVGTVPDFEPLTETEKQARRCLVAVFRKGPGRYLDMCYKPRQTRNLVLAKANRWTVCEGTQVVTQQLMEQWSLWVGERSKDIQMDVMAKRVLELADELAGL